MDYYLIITAMILAGCGGQLEFGDSQLSLVSERNIVDSSDDISDSPDQVPEEEIQAEMPAIISGSFLYCRPDVVASFGPHSILNCFPEDKHDLPAVKIGSKFKSKVGQQAIVFSVKSINIAINSLELSAEVELHKLQKELNSLDPNSPVILLKKEEVRQTTEPEPGQNGTEDTTENPSSAEPVTLDPQPKNIKPVETEPKVEIIELISNGSFEADKPTTFFGSGGFWGLFPEITGWNLETGSDIEIQNSLLNIPASDGNQWVELCSTGDSRIAQAIQTETGKYYELSYSVSARPDSPTDANSFLLYINGSFVREDTLLPQAVDRHSWTTVTHVFLASSSESNISFSSDGCAGGSSGSWIDNISVKLVEP